MNKNFVTQVLQDGIRAILRNPKYRWFAIIASLVYFFSPIDLIPDAIPLIGWIDDGVVMSFVIAEISQIIWEHVKANPKRKYQTAETVTADRASVNNTSVNNTIDIDAVTVN